MKLAAKGSARSCLQPCVSHSRIAPASFSIEIAQPRRSGSPAAASLSSASEIAPARRNLCAPSVVPHGRGIRNRGARRRSRSRSRLSIARLNPGVRAQPRPADQGVSSMSCPGRCRSAETGSQRQDLNIGQRAADFVGEAAPWVARADEGVVSRQEIQREGGHVWPSRPRRLSGGRRVKLRSHQAIFGHDNNRRVLLMLVELGTVWAGD